MGLGGQRHAPAALPPGKTRYTLYRRLGGPQGRSGLVRKISLPPGFDPPIVHPVASHYTDRAIPAFTRNGMNHNKTGRWLLRPACSLFSVTLWRVIYIMESLQSPLQVRVVLTSHGSASSGWYCPRRPLRTWGSPQSPQTHTWTRW